MTNAARLYNLAFENLLIIINKLTDKKIQPVNGYLNRVSVSSL